MIENTKIAISGFIMSRMDMRNWLLVLLLASTSVWAEPKDELNARLSKNDGFSADFTQKLPAQKAKYCLMVKGVQIYLVQVYFVGKHPRQMKLCLCLMVKCLVLQPICRASDDFESRTSYRSNAVCFANS